MSVGLAIAIAIVALGISFAIGFFFGRDCERQEVVDFLRDVAATDSNSACPSPLKLGH
jgi:hypothetical protein